MNDSVKLFAGLGASLIANVAWNSWPGHEAFRLKALSLTSPTGEVEKSPLAFIEHYHWGLASLIAGRYAGEYHALFDGFGLGMIASEAGSANPFGYGKTEWEVKGNVVLGCLLTGLLMVVVSK